MDQSEWSGTVFRLKAVVLTARPILQRSTLDGTLLDAVSDEFRTLTLLASGSIPATRIPNIARQRLSTLGNEKSMGQRGLLLPSLW
jgi:hypothetical protein